MTRQSRREFLEQSMLSAAAAAVASGWNAQVAQAEEAASSRSTSPNEKLGVAIVGAGGRGAHSHMPNWMRPDTGTEILWIVDPDEKRGRAAVDQAKKGQRRAPQFTRDMREAFADPAVDVASIATPNHWHSLAAIWAMQAGKDVYVEKPISHNVSEGRRCVEVARKYKRICQAGTQCRSAPGLRDAMEYLHQGNMGEVKLARGLCYKPRGSIGPRGAYDVPTEIDYNLWLGAAPLTQLTREKLHYDWHWQWPYGNGDLGNQGVHQMDVARWGLGETGLSKAVVSYGGRVGYEDAGDTPNTQVVMHDYGDKTLIFEVRGLSTAPYKPTHGGNGASVGVIFEGSDGRTMVVPSYHIALVYDRNGKEEQRFDGSGDEHLHFVNFLDAVRTRNTDKMTGDILEGHLSSALCHLGNISYVLGGEASLEDVQRGLPDFCGGSAQETFERTKVHLAANKIDPSVQLRMGASLKLDPSREAFIDNPAADKLLTREYREPFVVPAAGKV
ncbi:MAG TPA: Gfo/Idh/MocA family oxidoreductase [Pirellulales bacterium]|jgi:predicted dehydrogenase|nr:Gfo/Idh/MocA family oxidoreductase [Pirellulales bacterium]